MTDYTFGEAEFGEAATGHFQQTSDLRLLIKGMDIDNEILKHTLRVFWSTREDSLNGKVEGMSRRQRAYGCGFVDGLFLGMKLIMAKNESDIGEKVNHLMGMAAVRGDIEDLFLVFREIFHEEPTTTATEGTKADEAVGPRP